MGSGLAFCLYSYKRNFTNALHYCGQPRSFYKQADERSNIILYHPEDKRYLSRFHPNNEISMRLYEIFKTGKKQDLTPQFDLNLRLR